MSVVAYQGHAGAFSDVAARALVPGTETRGFSSFDAAAAALEAGETDFAALPFENVIAGPIPRNYEILWERPALRVRAHLVLPVELCLVGVDGTTIETIEEIRSHPVALEQVRRFSEGRPWRKTATTDTAGAVAEVAALGDRGVAAIGPALAAELYGATIIARGVEDEPRNATRFFLIGRGDDADATARANAVVGLALEDRPGSLRDALGAFADRGIDLRLVIARPLLGEPFRYRFFCELATSDDARLNDALAAIGGEHRVLGRY